MPPTSGWPNPERGQGKSNKYIKNSLVFIGDKRISCLERFDTETASSSKRENITRRNNLYFEKIIEDFDLDQIAASGQCFRMNPKEDGSYTLIAGDKYLTLKQTDNTVRFDCCEEDWEYTWRSFFDMDTDYALIKQTIDPDDTYLQSAVKIGGGIRILRQDLWEMIITFIISQQNHIPRIKRCVETICSRYGEQKTSCDGTTYYAFPTAEALALATEEDLRACGLGYRARYIHETACMVQDGKIDLQRLPKLSYEKAKVELLKLCGVGIKVAECICLFALHHIDAFPIDTHIKDMLEENYPEGFPFERYEGFAGVLQQYGFYYELHGKKS